MEVKQLPELTLESRGTAVAGSGIFWVSSDLGFVEESEEKVEEAGEEKDNGEDDYG